MMVWDFHYQTRKLCLIQNTNSLIILFSRVPTLENRFQDLEATGQTSRKASGKPPKSNKVNVTAKERPKVWLETEIRALIEAWQTEEILFNTKHNLFYHKDQKITLMSVFVSNLKVQE